VTSRRFLLAMILVLHIGLGVAFSLATPVFEPPDEANHYLFVRYLQVHRALPVQGLDRDGPRAHHPPLYFVLGALLSAWVPNDGPVDRIVMQLNPHVWFRYGDPNMDNKAMWIHYTPDERWPYRGQALAVHVIRLLSVGFSALAVWLTYLTARHLRPGDDTFALLAAGLLGFNAMVLFMSGVVQNSTSAIMSTAVVLYVLARFAREGFTFARWIWVGIAFAVGVLLQTSGLIMAAPIGVVLLYEAWRARRWRVLAEGTLGLLVPIAVLDGWWFVRNQLLYGDWTANSTIAALWTYGPIMPLNVALYLVGTGMVGRFGQGLMIDFPNPVYLAAGALALLAVVGMIKAAIASLRSSFHSSPSPDDAFTFRRQESHRGALRRRPGGEVLTPDFVLWSLQPITIVAVSVSLTIYVLKYIHGVHGRYMFTAFPSIALLLAAGLLHGFRPRWQATVTGLILALTLGLALYGLFGLLLPTYAIPRSPSQTELNLMLPLDADIGDTARVLGYTLSASSVRPGEELTVTIYWRIESRTDVPYAVFLHLYESSVGSITQLDTYPGLGNYATPVWDPGRTFADTYRLHVPADAPSVKGAKLVLGLYDEQTGQRLPVTGANAGLPEEAWVEFGNFQVQP